MIRFKLIAEETHYEVYVHFNADDILVERVIKITCSEEIIEEIMTLLRVSLKMTAQGQYGSFEDIRKFFPKDTQRFIVNLLEAWVFHKGDPTRIFAFSINKFEWDGYLCKKFEVKYVKKDSD